MTDLDCVAEALRLAAMGYRRTSNRHRMVSRVDRPDWREYMAQQHAPWDAERGTQDGPRWVRCLGEGAADHYRRTHSEDNLEGLPPDVFRRIPGSNGDDTGFVKVTE